MLHALSFTATYIAALQLIEQWCVPRNRIVMQTINWSIATGLCTGVGVAGSGLLYNRVGNGGYWFMCLPAALGLIIASMLRAHLRQPAHPRFAPVEPIARLGEIVAL